MTFNQDPNSPDFAAIYGQSGPAPAAQQPVEQNLAYELAQIGVTSLDGLNDTQLQDIATRLSAYRVKQTQPTPQQAQLAAEQAAQDQQNQVDQAAALGVDLKGNPLTPASGGPAGAAGAAGKMDPKAWLAYLQKVGPEGYGGDPQDYANAIYDAHYQVAQAGGSSGTPKPGDSGANGATAPAQPGTAGASAPPTSTRTATGAVNDATMARLQGYIANLQGVKNPTAGQTSELAKYTARETTYAGQNAAAAAQPPANPAVDAVTQRAIDRAPGVAGQTPPVAPITQPKAAPVSAATQAKLAGYVTNLSAVKAPTAKQSAELATYKARQIEYAGRG